MITGVNVDITIKDNNTGQYLRIPVIPEGIDFQGGDAITNTVSILNLGEVDYPNGVGLEALTWDSFFPARYDAAYCKYSDLKTPVEYMDQLKAWKKAGTSLQVIIPAAGINKTMRLATATGRYGGFEGDISYSLTLKELKVIRPIQLPITAVPIPIPPSPKDGAESRQPVAAGAAARTYTVIKGDYLIKIAKKLGISNWRTLYDANRDQIKNPNLIYPGQILRVP